MGHVSGHSVPVPHLGREGAAAHGRLPAAHGRRSRARVGGDGMAAAAPRLRCAAAGGAAGRCSVARHGLFASRRLYGRLRCPAVAARPCHAAENSEGFALRRLRRYLHGPAGRGPVRAVCGCAVAAPAAARSDPRGEPRLYAAMQRGTGLQLVFPLVCLLAACVVPPVLCGAAGLAPLAAAAGYCLAVWRGFRQLDGMSGDISGFSLTVGELAGAAVLCLVR